MVGEFRAIHQHAIKTLLMGFKAMERLSIDGSIQHADERQMIKEVLDQLNKFKRALPGDGHMPQAQGKSPCVAGSAAPSATHESRSDSRMPAEDSERLRDFLRDELRRLENVLMDHLLRR
jgi:hypothetical protein